MKDLKPKTAQVNVTHANEDGSPVVDNSKLFTLVHPDAKHPVRGYQGDAGFDLFAAEDVDISPITMARSTDILAGHVARVRTGVVCNLPKGWFGQISERSSQSLNGVFTAGNIVDEGYRGEIHVCIINLGVKTLSIRRGDKLAQLLLIPRYVDQADATRPKRGVKGYGSSDGQQVVPTYYPNGNGNGHNGGNGNGRHV